MNKIRQNRNVPKVIEACGCLIEDARRFIFFVFFRHSPELSRQKALRKIEEKNLTILWKCRYDREERTALVAEIHINIE